MPYEQQGNSCGAWCATHRISITNPAWMANANTFVAKALSIYGKVRFHVGDDDAAWTPARRTLYTQWCTNGYSDPWRIVSHLRWSGINAVVCIAPGAPNAGPLGEMRFILEHLGTKGVNPIQSRTLAGMAAGSYAIGVFDGGGLHFLLFRNGVAPHAGLQVYDPRSQQLNWTNIAAAPVFGGGFTTTIMNPGPTPQNYTFLGVFVAC
jgi:hypothetical protein